MQGLVAGLILGERFSLIRQLGKGGMGEIWLAEDRQLHEQVALKILDPAHSESTFVDLLRQECRKARGLVHPNIVRVFDFHAVDARFFISMQYIDGETLADSRRQAFQVITNRVLMVCDALEYAHRAGIIHRDVKASNVLRDRNGVCYLTDFGIAAAITGDRRFSDLRGGGSLPYMSPQQVAGEPAAVADDVYSLGALLHELLSGVPLFHPGVTAERIRDEEPAQLTVDGADQRIPDPLVTVVRVMLDKSAERRPAGIAAVRSVLEEVQADYPSPDEKSPRSGDPDADSRGAGAPGRGFIRPVARGSAVQTGSPDAGRMSVAGRRTTPKKAHSARLVYAGLGVLIFVALGVIFFLPILVQERGPVVLERTGDGSTMGSTTGSTGPATELPAGPDPSASQARQQIVDEVLGELLVIDDRLRALGVELWGGTDWTEARRLTEAGDASYRGRDYADALAQYRQSLTLMEILELRAPGVLAATLRDGQAALAAMDQAEAVRNFEIAIAIDGADPVARAGLERARRLDEVLALMNRAAAFEESNALADARDVYAAVLDLDSAWQPAKDGFERTGANLARNEYETQMAAGFGAMVQANPARARTAFRAALAARPGDADAMAALGQLDTEDRLREIIDLQNAGKAFEAQENWTLAAKKYEAILEIDNTLVSARQDLARSHGRAELNDRLANEISNPDRFSDDEMMQSANQLVERARSIENPGPVLTGQIDQLSGLLRIAAIPVPVEFRSDNLTNVVIYKVGRLGTFLNRTLDLKPGGYVAVGSRKGYRDVRRRFRVVATGKMEPILLACEEPI